MDCLRKKTSLASKISVSFLLLFVLWGVLLTAVSRDILRAALEKHSADQELINEIGRHITSVTTGLTLLGLLIASAVCIYISRNITRPIQKLADAVRHVADGQFGIQLSMDSEDEIGVLTDMFNRMTRELQQKTTSIDRLNSEIEERAQVEENLLAAKQQAEAATFELEKSNLDLERFNRAMLGREQKILELKQQVNILSRAAGHGTEYTHTEPYRESPDSSRSGPQSDLFTGHELSAASVSAIFERVSPLIQTFSQFSGVAAAIIDLNGNVILKSGWQKICTEFHRMHPEASKRCVESDTILCGQFSTANSCNMYDCKNGLTDICSPLVINGSHVANLFVGQFLRKPPSRELFREQARRMGFDEQAYLAALDEVPVLDDDKVSATVDFLRKLTAFLAELAVSEHFLRCTNEELVASRSAALSVMEDADRHRMDLEETNKKLKNAIELAQQLTHQAEQANRYKSEFLANISHEIRTPLNSIIGFGDLLAMEELKTHQQEYIELIRRSGDNLLKIVNDILDFSKIEAGKLEIKCEDFDPSQILEQIQGMLEYQAYSKGLDFEVHCDPDIPARISSDRMRLQQCLINLIDNAIKFTDQGYVRIHCRYDTSSPNCIAFEVEDTGIGIPESEQNRMYNAFTQIDGSHTRKFGGTGLGLTITRQLCELLGGELRVISRENAGTTFTLTIPTEKSPQADGPDEFCPQEPSGLSRADEHENPESQHEPLTGRVLVAEDTLTNQVLIEKLLTREGLQVDIARDGVEAVELSAQNHYDLILMDIQMPRMNGQNLWN